ncbi:MAG: helicase-related protein [Candidatus Nanoarchaeia archaeon]|nr:helicase-related protein [Candidatus Nanoarchaeia archaeon]
MKVIDNRIEKLGDDLKETIKANSKLQVCASIFSMYGFESLKKELSKIDSLKFIFTDPTFVKTVSNNKEQRKFEIDLSNREKSINGTEFEVRLKNELNGKAIAKECASWIEKKVKFKSNINRNPINKFINVEAEAGFMSKKKLTTYLNVEQFNTVGFGYEKGNSLFTPTTKIDDNYEMTKYYMQSFDELWSDSNNFKDVTEEVVNFISDLYKENSPEFIYYITLYNIFNEFLEDISEDEIANEKTGFKESAIWNTLYDFQKDAVLGLINKLERHNGCILADSVGLGKTFTALAVIKYYQERNKSVLVLCPKKLSENWNTYKTNYKDNILQTDRFNYDVLFHTDLSRKKGESNGIDLSRVNWGNYDLVVIDESHNFRNNSARKDRETRYDRLMNEVMKAGVKTKVLMLSATPVNNKFIDLKNQLALAYEGKTYKIDEKISSTKSIDTILKNAQNAFNDWSKLEVENRTSQELLNRLNSNFDFFKLLDSVTIARSRRHIEKYYNTEDIGKFPTRLKPISISSEITDIEDFMSIKEISETLMRLNMSIYAPFDYILDNRLSFYEKKYDITVKEGKSSFRQADREKSLKILMRINLLKRLESSVESFRLTLNKIMTQIDNILNSIENFEKNGVDKFFDDIEVTNYDIDEDVEDLINDDFSIGTKVKIDLKDINTIGWKEDLRSDGIILKNLLNEMNNVSPEHDLKLQKLIELISNKVQNPINGDNKKVIIFSAFADTANYLYKNLNIPLKNKYNLDTAKITGSGTNECTLNISKDFNNLLINFSPKSKHREMIIPNSNEEIEVLIATDCISEGQNLQDCDYLVNYDIHWNPVRIIQRFGRVDRIGSINKVIQLVNFWPNLNLDDYINLKNRVENRMLMLDISGTGEDNVLTNKSSDMEYRKEQLKKLQEEVVDLEEMNTGISITDLGLNDFRMDLIEYVNHNGDLSKTANGMHSVVFANPEKGIEKGVIYVLKNINNEVNIDNMNQLHPFYLIYIKNDGSIISNHLNVKNTLDILRVLTKGNIEPIKEAYKKFNEETNDGKNMQMYSNLLNSSIDSIINIKEESDIDSLFKKGGTTMLKNDIKGLDDFELISFMVVI